jgi:CxC2 like cysteine cluster associated with KDZ transposases
MDCPPTNNRICQSEGCSSPRSFRCRDCFGGQMLCSPCITSAHIRLPFHKTEFWTGTTFVGAPLITLEHILHLGHQGNPCPNRFTPPRSLNVLHINGHHRLMIAYCQCDDSEPNDRQLMAAQIFPATAQLPQTAFTFAVLKHFQLFNLASAMSASNYYNAVSRLSDPVQPASIPVSAIPKDWLPLISPVR